MSCSTPYSSSVLLLPSSPPSAAIVLSLLRLGSLDRAHAASILQKVNCTVTETLDSATQHRGLHFFVWLETHSSWRPPFQKPLQPTTSAGLRVILAGKANLVAYTTLRDLENRELRCTFCGFSGGPVFLSF